MEKNRRESLNTMAKNRRKTTLKNFRLPDEICRWLEDQKVATGYSQTRLIIDALKEKYRPKGRTA